MKISCPRIFKPSRESRRSFRVRWPRLFRGCMLVTVRQADLTSDAREIVDILQQNLPDLPHARFFQWLYCRNPEGRALAWVATDPQNHRIVGVAGAFPRRIYC